MANRISPEKRSRIISSIRSKDTRIELKLRRALWKEGLRYRLHYHIAGKPDVAFPSARVAVLVDGDFWHGYDWPQLREKLNSDFWYGKILNNRKRDRKVNRALKAEGWTVLRFWEHQINNDPEGCARRVREAVRGGRYRPGEE
ncbi:MAG: very short patch repair endonuclease [Candidatus Erginobacter occultus]|nr:very short patch repair endonuclease [Candidatus Erginobacter occultus]